MLGIKKENIRNGFCADLSNILLNQCCILVYNIKIPKVFDFSGGI
ncbi:MAG: hypothetical protein PWQ96_1383 [Clostridia bacterium]|jgi:hypothetical protein|nr:hypothetical protein [Clostridiales bacterium]MDK2985741.1 hypothetical protein [Clostridia bacterium]